MKTRRATADTYYNGRCIQTTTENFQTSFEYSDPDSGESDSISVSLADPQDQWISAWMPSKGDEISAVIRFEHRDTEGQTIQLDCGKFIVDDLSFNASASGTSFKISGVSAPADDAFSATTRTQTWENVTLQKVAQTIANRYQLALVFDAADVKLSTQEQSDAADSAFLSNLCKTYGFCMKVFSKKLVIFDREAYKEKDPVATIAREDMDSFQWNTTLAGSYTGGTIAYTVPKQKKDLIYKTGTGKRLLKVNTKADSLADAKRKLEAAIAAANHSMTTISFTCIGRPGIVSGQTITVTGFGKLSGKYYIDSKTDSLAGAGYKTRISASLVQSGGQAVILDAVDRLEALGVINNPSYWKAHYKDVRSLDGLLLNMATVIKTNGQTGLYSDPTTAVEHLAERGIINSPAYWTAHLHDLSSLPLLMVKAANAG